MKSLMRSESERNGRVVVDSERKACSDVLLGIWIMKHNECESEQRCWDVSH